MTALVSLLFLAASASAADADAPPATSPVPFQDETPPPPSYPHWYGTLSLGASWTDGNTESDTVTGTFNAIRRDEDDRWTFDAFTNYGSTTDTVTDESDITTNNSGGGAKYDYFYSEKAYLFGNASAKVDHVADLDLRWIAGAGLGYQWKETEKLKWGTEAGLSYVDEDFEDDEFDTDFLAARFASNLMWQFSETSSFTQVAEVLPSLDDSEDVIAKIDNRLNMTIVGKWIAQIQYVLDFDGSVPTGELPGPDGKEETDHRVVLAIGWSFGEPTP
jgi:putative salt-induced outer membrane protein YdiY